MFGFWNIKKNIAFVFVIILAIATGFIVLDWLITKKVQNLAGRSITYHSSPHEFDTHAGELYGLGNIWSIHSNPERNLIAISGRIGTSLWEKTNQTWQMKDWFERIHGGGFSTFSPRGKYLVCPYTEKESIVYNVENGERLTVPKVTHCDFSEDEQKVALAHPQGFCVYDLYSNKTIFSVDKLSWWWKRKIYFSSNGKTVLVDHNQKNQIGEQSAFYIYDVEKEKKIGEISDVNKNEFLYNEQENTFYILDYDRVDGIPSPHNGPLFNSISITKYPVESGIKEFHFQIKSKSTVKDHLPSKNWLCTVDANDAISIWDLKNGVRTHQWKPNNFRVYSACFSKEGSHVFVVGYRGWVAYWPLDKISPSKIEQLETGRVENPTFLSNHEVVFVDLSNQVWLWKQNQNVVLFTDLYQDPITYAQLFGKDKYLLTLENNSKISIWDRKSRERIRMYQGRGKGGSHSKFADISPNEQFIAYADNGPSAVVVDWKTNAQVQRFRNELILEKESFFHRKWTFQSLYEYFFQPQPNRSAQGASYVNWTSNNEMILDHLVWDWKTGKLISTVIDQDKFPSLFDKRTIGSYTVVTKDDGINENTRIEIHNETGSEQYFIPTEKRVRCFHISSNEEWLVYGMEWSIVLYNLKTKMKLSKLHFDGPTSIQFSDDGSKFVVTSHYGMAKVYELAALIQ